MYLCAAKTSSDVEVSGYTVLMSHPVQVKKELRRGSYPHIESSHIRCDYSEPLLCSGTDILVVPQQNISISTPAYVMTTWMPSQNDTSF